MIENNNAPSNREEGPTMYGTVLVRNEPPFRFGLTSSK